MTIGLRLINLGSAADAGDGDSARSGGIKINTNFVDIYSQFGSVPIENDPTNSKYGTLKSFDSATDLESFLHPAGYWQKVEMENPGVTRPSDSSDANTFFLSRGEQVVLDFSKMTSGESCNLVLPLGRKGDVVKIRDAFNTLKDNKRVKVFASAYKYTGSNTWEFGDINKGSPGVPSNSHVLINNISRSWETVNLGGVNVSRPLSQDELFFTKTGLNLEFVYGGDEVGWTFYKIDPFDPAAELAGKELFERPVYSAIQPRDIPPGSGIASQPQRIIFNPKLNQNFVKRTPTTGTPWVEGRNEACNTIFLDEDWWDDGNGNSFILKPSSVLGYSPRTWDIFLPYPRDASEEAEYKSRTVTLVNDSNRSMRIAPMVEGRNGIKRPGKNFLVLDNVGESDITNYDYIEGIYDPLNPPSSIDDMALVFDPSIRKVKFVYADYHPYDAEYGGWIITHIEKTDSQKRRQREFVITDVVGGINPPDLPRYETEFPVSKLDVATLGNGSTVSNIITGLSGSDPSFSEISSQIQAIDLEIYVNGVSIQQGDRFGGDFYAFKGESTQINDSNPDDYASMPEGPDKRYSEFNAVHFNRPLLPGDHVLLRYKSLEDLDTFQQEAIADIVASTLPSINVNPADVISSGDGLKFGIIRQSGSGISASGGVTNNFVMKETDWDQGYYD